MNTLGRRPRWQRGWMLGLAGLSVLAPLTTVLGTRVTSSVSSTQNYLLTVAVLVLGVAAAIIALLGSWAPMPAWSRWFTIGVAGLGLMGGAALLWSLIGLCGLQVLGGGCGP